MALAKPALDPMSRGRLSRPSSIFSNHGANNGLHRSGLWTTSAHCWKPKAGQLMKIRLPLARWNWPASACWRNGCSNRLKPCSSCRRWIRICSILRLWGTVGRGRRRFNHGYTRWPDFGISRSSWEPTCPATRNASADCPRTSDCGWMPTISMNIRRTSSST